MIPAYQMADGGDQQGVRIMGNFFNNASEAWGWLHANNWTQGFHGEWTKGKKKAEIRPSPSNDGVVCVVITKA